jgi:hypothetical protein
LSGQSILEMVMGALLGTGVLGALFAFVGKGYWMSNVAPLVETEIRKWYQAREQLEEREKEVRNLLRTPAVSEESTKAVKLIIDNEIKRSDGLISREIHSQVNEMESRLLSKLEELSDVIKDDTAFKQEMLRKMGKLEGAINTILPAAKLGAESIAPERSKR